MSGTGNKKPSNEEEPQGESEEEEDQKGIRASIKSFIYGAAMHGMSRQALKSRMYFEHMFMLITLGDLMGIPILPPYYSLRILPYVVPQIKTWKRRMLKERDLTDALY